MKFKKKLLKILSIEIKPENSGLVSGIFTVVMALLAFGATFSHSAASLKSVIGPVTVPRMVAGIVLALGIAQIIRHFVKKKKTPATAVEPAPEEDDKPIEKMQVFKAITPWVSFALIALYIFLMRKIGFVLSSTLYLTLQIPLLSVDLSRKSFFKAFIIGVITAVIVFLIFAKGFGLRLPTNGWGF